MQTLCHKAVKRGQEMQSARTILGKICSSKKNEITAAVKCLKQYRKTSQKKTCLLGKIFC